MEITAILIMSVLVEALITYVKTWVVNKEFKWPMLVSAVLSIIICIAYGIDIPAAVGLGSNIPFIGMIITGVLISRGSNYINDLLKRLAANKAQPFEETDVEI